MANDKLDPKKAVAALPPRNRDLAELPKMSAADLALMGGGMDSEDIAVPRLVILQSLSPEVTTERVGQPGDFYLKGLNLNLGRGPLEIIPLLRSKSRMRWKPMDMGGGILCQSSDGVTGVGEPGGNCGTCTKKDWIHKDAKTGKLKPDCDLNQNVICVLRGQSDWVPVAFSGSRTRLKAFKELNSLLMIELNKGRPIFTKCYAVKSVTRQSGAIVYQAFTISPGNNNQLLPPDEQKKAWDFFQGIKGKKLIVTADEDEMGIPAEHHGPQI